MRIFRLTRGTVHARSPARRAALTGGATSDGRTQPALPPYKDAAIRTANYNHDAFEPGINTDTASAATKKAAKPVLVRVPVVPVHFNRDLCSAAWDAVKHGKVETKMGLCIIHCGMRTMESNLKRMLVTVLERFKDASGSDQALVETHLNEALKRNLKMRPLVTTNDKGDLNDISLNGDEVKICMDDLVDPSKSELLKAVRDTLAALKLSASKMDAWASCLGHWARAMKAGYEMRATDAHRDTFRTEIRWYVAEKVTINNEAMVWYDWQLWSIMPMLFDAFGSLRLICQEGMEAQQRLNNDIQRRSNGNGNAGRIPNKTKAAGVAAIKAYLLDRAKRMKTPAQWLWEQMLLSFVATYQSAFERLEACREAEKVVDWATEFVPAWTSFKWLSRARCNLASSARMNLDRRAHGGESLYHAQLLREYHAYYAPCDCEAEETWSLLRPEDRLVRLHTERHRRWKQLRAGSLYVDVSAVVA